MMGKEYLFNSDRIYPRLPSGGPAPGNLLWHKYGGCIVKSGSLICYDVVQVIENNLVGGNTWDFKVRGYEGITFRTNYDWALVENTGENIALLRNWREARKDVERADARASSYWKRLVTVSAPVVEPTSET
jgi:hypothetical protein